MSPEFMNCNTTPEQRVAFGDVVLARELVNKQDIEQQAAQLVLTHQLQVQQGPLSSEKQDNAVTGLFERITAAGDLSEVNFAGDQTQIHLATRHRILNSLLQEMPAWDKKRCFYELCEELTIAKVFDLIKSGTLPADTKIITVSDFPDEPVADQEKHDRGYRTLNKKGMLRSYHFEQDGTGQWTRVLEQLSRSNSNDTSTKDWFNKNASAVPLSSTGALAEQYLVSKKRLPDGVITLAKELDAVYGTNRLYGDDARTATLEGRPGYNTIRQHSRQWRQQLEFYTAELTEYEEFLQTLRLANEISYDKHLQLFHNKIDTIIARLVLLAPQFAKDSYGDASVQYIQQASMAFYLGDQQLAAALLQKAETHKDKRASTGCGGRGEPQEDPFAINPTTSEAVASASLDKKNWKWKEGICVVQTCGTRPGKTKVGPCSVCKKCQAVFDSGGDPTKKRLEVIKNNKEATFTINSLARVVGKQLVNA